MSYPLSSDEQLSHALAKARSAELINGKRRRWLDQPHALQARTPASADDDVIVHGDAERPRDVDDRAGHLDVGLRWRRVATGGVVHEVTLLPIDLKAQQLPKRRSELGTGIGGCRPQSFVIITLPYGSSRLLAFDPRRSLDVGSHPNAGHSVAASEVREGPQVDLASLFSPSWSFCKFAGALDEKLRLTNLSLTLSLPTSTSNPSSMLLPPTSWMITMLRFGSKRLIMRVTISFWDGISKR